MPTFTVVLFTLTGIAATAQAQKLHPWGDELKPVLGVLEEAAPFWINRTRRTMRAIVPSGLSSILEHCGVAFVASCDFA